MAVAADLIDFLNASPTAFHAVGTLLYLILSSFSLIAPQYWNQSCVFFSYCLIKNYVFNWFFFGWVSLEEAKKRLKSAGYVQIFEREDWDLKAGNKYFFTRNHSTIVAFALGKKYAPNFYSFYFSEVRFFCSICNRENANKFGWYL